MRGRPLKTSAVWKLVRERIASGRSVGVHWAIMDLEFHKEISLHRACELTNQIAGLLHPAPTYRSWIRLRHPKVWANTPSFNRFDAAQQGQLDWLDHLIAEAKAKGD